MVGTVKILTYARCSRITVQTDVTVIMVRMVFVSLDDDGIWCFLCVVETFAPHTSHLTPHTSLIENETFSKYFTNLANKHL